MFFFSLLYLIDDAINDLIPVWVISPQFRFIQNLSLSGLVCDMDNMSYCFLTGCLMILSNNVSDCFIIFMHMSSTQKFFKAEHIFSKSTSNISVDHLNFKIVDFSTVLRGWIYREQPYNENQSNYYNNSQIMLPNAFFFRVTIVCVCLY